MGFLRQTLAAVAVAMAVVSAEGMNSNPRRAPAWLGNLKLASRGHTVTSATSENAEPQDEFTFPAPSETWGSQSEFSFSSSNGFNFHSSSENAELNETRSSSEGRIYASIKFRETWICEVTEGVKAYAGYINLPKDLDYLQPYDRNIFFWFFESRNNASTAPLVVWLNGGDGLGSIDQAVSGYNGPCQVFQDTSVRKNPHSWNNHANILYIDHTVQAGYSYDKIRKGWRNMLTGKIEESQLMGSQSYPETILRKGKFATGLTLLTPKTSALAARTIGQAIEVWKWQ